jgi:uncharacterized protein (TIGR02284 family)
MNDLQDTLSTLDELISVCKDGKRGFATCAARADSPALRASLERRALACGDAAAELRAEAIRLGGLPVHDGTAAGALHRSWVAARSLLSPDDDLAMLEECERGESVALARYRAALHRRLPDSTRVLIETQLQGVQRNHADVCQLLLRERDLA